MKKTRKSILNKQGEKVVKQIFCALSSGKKITTEISEITDRKYSALMRILKKATEQKYGKLIDKEKIKEKGMTRTFYFINKGYNIPKYILKNFDDSEIVVLFKEDYLWSIVGNLVNTTLSVFTDLDDKDRVVVLEKMRKNPKFFRYIMSLNYISDGYSRVLGKEELDVIKGLNSKVIKDKIKFKFDN